MDWFNSANLGIFIHWGLYAVPAFDNINCAKMRTIQNGSEWYYNRLTKTFRVSKSDTITKDYHKAKYGDMKYEDFAKQFTGAKFNADEWCKFIKNIGATYVVFTAKHHDGFCMWNTKTTNNNIMNSAMKRDALKELREAAHKYKLKFGIYYSWLEFGRTSTEDYIKTVVKPQLIELMKYKPDLWWMDGDWTATADKWQSDKFVMAVNKAGAIINSRLGKGTKGGDYDNFSDRFIADKKMDKRYESCQTWSYSWGINNQQKEKDYKTSEQMFEIYKKVINTNGNLLLNIGPDKDGNFDKIEEKRLIELGKLIK